MAVGAGKAAGTVGGAAVDGLTVGASIRLGLADAAEAFCGYDPGRVLQRLSEWAQQAQPPLPWLPGPLLDALAPLGIEVPRTEPGRLLARLLVGVPADVDEIVDAIAAVRHDAYATAARRTDDEAGLWEDALRQSVDDAVAVLVSEYAALGESVADGDRHAATLQADDALGHVAMASSRIADLAVQLVGARPVRLTATGSPRPPTTLDLSAPWQPSPPRPPRDRIAGAVLFLVLALLAALTVVWAVLDRRWP